MAFFKRTQQKVNDLWYPKAITVGKPVTTDEIADELSIRSTVTRGDTYAVMKNLGAVMANYMAQGRTVKIEGVGTFYYTAVTNKQGVATADEVTAAQITGIRVRFLPEVGRDSHNNVVTRSMVNTKVFWEEWGSGTSAGGSSSDGQDDSEGGGMSQNPL